MNNKGVAIRYGDVAPEAKENFVPTASESEFDTLAQLQQYNLNFPNYANPCELYSVVLDGTAQAFPSVPENANLGLWSEQISNDDGTFTEPIVLTLRSEGQYSSQGFTFTFDTYNQIYPTRINIHWWRDAGGTLTDLGEETFTPDNAFYFCRRQVENYNRIVITFYSLNMPKNRLKLRVVDYGYGTFFYGDELRNVKLIQEIDPISSQISINTADFTLDSSSDIEYSFQQKQPLSIYFNGELKATTFVKSSKRKARFLWDIQSEDYIGVLDSIPYYGGIYTNANAVELLTDIFTVAKVPYSIDDVFADATVTGHIPYTTCRDALMQVAFAIQAVVDTSDSDAVKIFALDDEVKQTVPLNRIMQGQNFTDKETVTSVEITAHSFVESRQYLEAYTAKERGIGESIFVLFDEPLHTLQIGYSYEDWEGEIVFKEDETYGQILESGANFAIIDVFKPDCVLRGKTYKHTTSVYSKKNPLVLASELDKIVSIENATLVSVNNVDNILKKCYNWLIKTSETNLKIVEGKHISYEGGTFYGEATYGTATYGDNGNKIIKYDRQVSVGDTLEAETEFSGNVSGVIVRQAFNLNGNIIIKEAVLK